jgi:hypothetical protein
MLHDTRNKNMYVIRVGVSIVFEKAGHFLFKEGRGWDHHVWS